MLQDFPAEVAVARAKKKPAELEGFYSERPKLARQAAAVVADLQEFRSELPTNARAVAGPVLTMLAIAVMVVVFVASWRPAPVDALGRTATSVQSNIVLPAEPVALAALDAPAAPAKTVVEKPRLSARVDRKSAIATSAPRRMPSPVETEPAPAQLLQVPLAAQMTPVVAAAKIETAPRRLIELPAEPPQVNTASVRTVVFDETAAIQDVIRRYENAYERLDAAAAKQIWPSLDERALAKAFAGLASQTISLQPCRVDVTSASAIALCNGYATYIGRVGNKAGQIQRRTWRFQLLKSGDNWRIGSVQSN
jgi:hypothetical protein